MIDDKYLVFLKQHTSELPHSGRSLLDHLIGTYDLLQEWGSWEHVSLAGLFHSIYGTQFYQRQAVPVENRQEVADLIGPQAEALAYMFCTEDRRHFLDDPCLSEDVRSELLEIEAANLLEQGGNITRALYRLLQSNISVQAKAAIKHRIVEMSALEPKWNAMS